MVGWKSVFLVPVFYYFMLVMKNGVLGHLVVHRRFGPYLPPCRRQSPARYRMCISQYPRSYQSFQMGFFMPIPYGDTYHSSPAQRDKVQHNYMYHILLPPPIHQVNIRPRAVVQDRLSSPHSRISVTVLHTLT